jgi:uncharacterized protein (DUF2147 family)
MKLVVFLLLLITRESYQCQNVNPDYIVGNWISPDNDLIINCYKKNNKYYGKIVWFKKYYDAEHDKPKAVPESQWLYMNVMTDFEFSDNEWTNGEIFNLNTGKKYDAFIKQKDNNTLKVTGYIFLPIFCESVLFKKYTEPKLPVQVE